MAGFNKDHSENFISYRLMSFIFTLLILIIAIYFRGNRNKSMYKTFIICFLINLAVLIFNFFLPIIMSHIFKGFYIPS
jgi:uncharacterized membrane protein